MSQRAAGRSRPASSAKDRALGLLAVRWRSRAELERRLRTAGFETQEVSVALLELEAAGLIDDARFARAVVADRAGRRLAGDRAVRGALLAKGVAPEVADEAMREAGDEEERALALATRRAGRLSGETPDAAFRRLYGLLLRRGFGPSVARDATRRALRDLVEDAGEPDDPA